MKDDKYQVSNCALGTFPTNRVEESVVGHYAQSTTRVGRSERWDVPGLSVQEWLSGVHFRFSEQSFLV